MKVSRRQKGMTLIELICVMGILATAMAFSAPMLSRFFAGRTLAEESRRFLALTRFARSEAASQGLSLELRVKPTEGLYGLSPQSPHEDFDEIEYEPVSYTHLTLPTN